VLHKIPVDQLGVEGETMAAAVASCVHCGFCLPTCPTYVEMGEEMDSPRGRIFLMKEVLEGGLDLDLALPYIDNCLGCLACETACPSGVPYGNLITPFRALAEVRRKRAPLDRLRRAVVLRTLPHPRRFRMAAHGGRAVKRFAGLLPDHLAATLDLLPAHVPASAPLPAIYPALGLRRARVALLAGCAQQVLAPDINWATLRVLARNGVETVIPITQGCCGALPLHAGDKELAKKLARRNLAAFAIDVDAIVTNAAGCGSGMREYGLLFAEEPDEEVARSVADSVVDVSAFLMSLGLSEQPPALTEPIAVAYHDACHLAHAQQIRRQPRELLRSIEGVQVVEPAEWELCCGSAGTYNVEKPETALALGDRKVENLLNTGAGLLATGNIGCMTQLQTRLRARGSDIEVLHTVQVLDRAYSRSLDVI
jgi:glycolate oxidase iron-sulfur subunit